ncbi:MAG: CdaR family protein [Candidatus Aminicenantales bacterium]
MTMQPIRDFFVRNWGLKLFSFLMALLLWLILIPEEKTYSDKTLAVPLETRNVPADMEIVERPAASIDVTVRAPNRLLNELAPPDILARLDLGKATVYQDVYPLNASMITIPQGAEVVGISPNIVRLKLEKTKQMDLEVAPMIIGKVGAGLKIARIEVFPARVPVKGAESKIRTKDKVTTSPVDVSRLKETATIEADIILPRPDLRLATSQTKVRVSIFLEENAKPSNEKVARDE